jgi:hypothetical protein
MTIFTDDRPPAEGGVPAPGVVTGLIDLATWYATHPSAPMVTPTLNIPVPAGERGARVIALDVIAEQLGVQVAPLRDADGETDGTLIAERWFGGVRVEAHLCPEDRSMRAWRDSNAGRTAIGANGATA